MTGGLLCPDFQYAYPVKLAEMIARNDRQEIVQIMPSVILVDDERPALDLLAHLLSAFPQVKILAQCQKPAEALARIADLKPDAVFLDIEMPGINGIELASGLEDIHPGIQIVFVTAYNTYALQAFEVCALDYLLKPVEMDRLEKTVSRLHSVSASYQPPDTSAKADRQLASIGMLGKWLVSDASGQLVRWPTSRVEELLACLLLNRTVISKWQLMDLLWPDADGKHAEQNLYSTIYRLKKTLREYDLNIAVEVDKGSYRLSVAPGMVWDIRILRDNAGRSDLASLLKAIAAYQDELLTDREWIWLYPFRLEMLNLFREAVITALLIYLQQEQSAAATALFKKSARLLQPDTIWYRQVRERLQQSSPPQLLAKVLQLLAEIASEAG